MKQEEFNLLDVIEREEIKENIKPCNHRFEEHSVTVWPGETCERLTMTCKSCGRVRGRYPKE